MSAARVWLRGRLEAEPDSVLGSTAPLGDPPTPLRPSMAVVWEAMVSEVAPSPMKSLMTVAGMVSWAAGAVWKVPPLDARRRRGDLGHHHREAGRPEARDGTESEGHHSDGDGEAGRVVTGLGAAVAAHGPSR